MKTLLLAAFASLLLGCGARTGVAVDLEGTPEPLDASPRDAGPDAGHDASLDGGPDASRPPDAGLDAGCIPLGDGCLLEEQCGNGANDDCDDQVDEGCACAPGEVQSCFLGGPGRRDVGACQDGSQTCTGDSRWGECLGGVLPDADACTGRDDLCDGCSEERVCMIDCPSPGDPRVPEGQPFNDYPLDGRDFYAGPAASWRWTVTGGPCDDLAPNLESFELRFANTDRAVFIPKLSGEYRVTLRVTAPSGEVLECSWVVSVRGPGLRVEMCYPESETQDLDLYLHNPNNDQPWYRGASMDAFSALPEASCGWHTCEARVRQPTHPLTGLANERADWGYAPSPLSACENGPQGAQWRELGFCANPRLDIDNNLSAGIGVPENINVDAPNDGETFRIMVHNFTGVAARPVVNVYCAGRRVATYGLSPDEVPDFEGARGDFNYGAMWRVADVTTRVTADGSTACEVQALHPAGETTGYRVTYNDPGY